LDETPKKEKASGLLAHLARPILLKNERRAAEQGDESAASDESCH
jgi:hypothetical protein